MKGKIGKSIEERTKQDKTKEEQNKTKAKTKQQDKCEKNTYRNVIVTL